MIITTRANSERLENEIWKSKLAILTPNDKFYGIKDDIMNRLVVLIAINKEIKTTEDLEYKAYCEIQYNELKQSL